jgi:sulfoxide reductase heme-binding subunit YedZ
MDKINLAPEHQDNRLAGLNSKVDHVSIHHRNLIPILSFGAFVIIVLILFVLTRTSAGAFLGGTLSSLFALDSQQVMWYITRAAGITSYILLWFSSAWGLAVASKITDVFLHRSFTYDFHQFISLLAVGFIFLHILVLLFDRYLPYTLAQILIPFVSPYRPLWVGIGVLGFYLTLLVTITFYMRSRIGMKAFRAIHVSSLAAYLGGTIHGFFSGTDSSLWTVQLMYAITFLIMVFLTTYWFIVVRNKKAPILQATPTKKKDQPVHSRHHPSRA